MMNKLLLTAAMALALSAGAVSAAQVADESTHATVLDKDPGNGVTYRLAELHSEHAFGTGTYSAAMRNVGPSSTVTGYNDNGIANANAGNPINPLAPAAGSASGGGGQ